MSCDAGLRYLSREGFCQKINGYVADTGTQKRAGYISTHL